MTSRGRSRGPALLPACLLVGLGLARTAFADDVSERADEGAEGASEPSVEVVVGGRSPTAVRADPTPAAYVLREDALAAPGLGAADVLARVPGLQTTRSGGAADPASASLRGASGAQTPIYLAGILLNDPLRGQVDLSTLPLWMLHRVEIYRGNAPVGADQLGIGGAVLLQPRLPRRPEARVALGLGSFGEREGRAGLMVGGADRQGEAGAALAVRHHGGTGDYSFIDDGGTRFDDGDDVERRRVNADYQELDVWTLAAMSRGRARLTLVFNAYGREAGAPGLQLIGARQSRSEERRVLAGSSASVACPGGGGGELAPCELLLDVGASTSRYRLDDPLREIGPDRRAEMAGQRLSERLRLVTRMGDEVELGFGGSQAVELVRVDLDGDAATRARRQLWRSEVYALWRVLDELTVVAVGALECHSTAARGGAAQADGEQICGVLAPVGRVGARWHLLPQLALFGNLGRSVRVPTLAELFGVSEVVRGNSELTPEEGVNADVGLAAEQGAGPAWLWAQLVGFMRFADDLIAYRRATFGAVRPYNTQRARVLGLELAAGTRLWKRLEAGTSLTLLDPRDISDDRTVQNDLVPLQARLVVAPYLELSSPRWSAVGLDRATVAARYLHRSSRVADPAGLLVVDEQHDLEIDGSLTFARRLTLRGRLSNLLDRPSYDLIGYPLPGRAGHISLEAWW